MSADASSWTTRSAAATIVGRDEELAEVVACLAREQSAEGGMLVTAEPGMGKTTIWSAAVAALRQQGTTVLVAQPAESDQRRSFSGLGDLFRPVGPRDLGALPRPLRHALDVALLRTEPEADATEPSVGPAVGPAVLALLEGLAAQGPIVVAIDDMQWLDSASVDGLAFALRRISTAPVTMLLTRRTGSITAFEAALRGVPIRRLDLAPLSLGAVRRLLVDRLGLELPRRSLRELHARTGGNPLFALELAALGASEIAPVALDEVLGARLAGLPDTVQDVLVAVALTPAPEPAELSEAVGFDAVSQAEAAGVLVLDDHGARATHPMLASVALARARRPARRRLHAALAAVTPDVERRARHEANATDGPDAALASTLAAAGDRAAARGAFEDAVDLAGEALRLTPTDDAERAERLLVCIERLNLTGEQARAVDIGMHALAELPPGPVRARVRLLVTEAQFHLRTVRVLDVGAAFAAALADVAGDERLVAMILARRAHHTTIGPVVGIRAAVRDAREAWRLSENRWPDTAAAAAHSLGWVLHVSGRSTVELRARVAAAGIGSTDLQHGFDRLEAEGLLVRGHVREARAILSRLVALADERGETLSFVTIRLQLIELELRAGRWAVAAAMLDEWVDSPERHLTTPSAYQRTRSFVASGIGLADEAERWALEALAHSEERGLGWDRLESLRALGLARLAAGRPLEAIEPLLAVWTHTRREGIAEPGVFPVAGDLVDALVQVGRLDAARAVARSVARFGRICDRPWALLTGERGLALVALAAGEAGAGERLWSVAGRLADLGLSFDAARTLLALGRGERRRRQWGEARRALEAARQEFEALGSTGWVAIAEAETRRLGGRRPDTTGSLTAAEAAVARLVADGLSNKEIAGSLAVSVATVERHLSRAYAKLGVQSRAQLTRRLGAADRE